MITSQTTRINHIANGVASSYGYNFYILAAEDLKITTTNPSTGVITPKTLNVDYTLSGVRQNTGGTITFMARPASGQIVSMNRQTPRLQPDDYKYNDSFPSETVETSLDREICIVQELATLLEDIYAAIAADTSDIKVLKQQVAQIQQQIAQLEPRVSTLESKVSAIGADLDLQKLRIDDLLVRVGLLRTEVLNTIAALSALETALNTETQNRQAADGALGIRIDTLSNRIDGMVTAYVFDTEVDMFTAVANPAFKAKLKIGNDLYIREQGVPDYWWDGTQPIPLETQKVDLTGYATTNQLEAEKTARTQADNALQPRSPFNGKSYVLYNGTLAEYISNKSGLGTKINDDGTIDLVPTQRNATGEYEFNLGDFTVPLHSIGTTYRLRLPTGEPFTLSGSGQVSGKYSATYDTHEQDYSDAYLTVARASSPSIPNPDEISWGKDGGSDVPNPYYEMYPDNNPANPLNPPVSFSGNLAGMVWINLSESGSPVTVDEVANYTYDYIDVNMGAGFRDSIAKWQGIVIKVKSAGSHGLTPALPKGGTVGQSLKKTAADDFACDWQDDATNGWTAVIANVADGARIVQKVVDWTGGNGAKPATNVYIGATGYVADIAQATDIRGASAQVLQSADDATAQTLSQANPNNIYFVA